MRQTLETDGPWGRQIGYSRAVRIGSHVWVAGTAPAQDGQLVHPGDAYAQARFVLDKIASSLKAVGATMQDVVRTRIYVTDRAAWSAIARAHGEVFGDIRPVATMVLVSGLITEGMLVEIEVEGWVEQ